MYSFYASAYSILRHRILSSLSNLLRPTTTQETMASQDSANDHKNIVYGAARLCMVEYYHEENEALHKALPQQLNTWNN